MGMIRPGQQFGRWVTSGEKALGRGGSGEVWAVTAGDGVEGAIKVLLGRGGRAGRYRLGRFRDEIGFLLARPGFPGILPVIDSDLPDDQGQAAWYVMPVATPIREALGDDPDPATVVSAVAEIAGTLAALADQGVGHRDIKPDNLFRLEDRWVIGDFGLVTYPEKDPVTEHGRKLGPVDYMAPEMRQDADTAAFGPADVWALAKTLWVLLTGQSLPLPGTHRPADAAHSLQQRIVFRFAAELDLLLEHATQTDPRARPAVGDVAAELRACTAQPPEARPSASLKELSARLGALTAAGRRGVSAALDRRGILDAAWGQLAQVINDTARDLAGLLTFDLRAPESGYRAAGRLGDPPFRPHDVRSLGCLLLPPGQSRSAVEVTVAGAMRILREGGPADIAVVLEVHRILDNGSRHEVTEVWAGTYQGVPSASARQAHALAEIRAALAGGYDPALRAVINILAPPPDADCRN